MTSREIAGELGLSEETVRHDLKFVDIEGRPGAGYDLGQLHDALQEYLDLSTGHPFIAIGNAEMLRGLAITFPATAFGLRLVAYYSDRAARRWRSDWRADGSAAVRPVRQRES